MNQRVDELAWQAGCNQVSHHDPVRPECNGWIINQETLDRFAELLVRECAKKGFDIFDQEPDAPPSDLQFYVRDGIMKHFGVEP